MAKKNEPVVSADDSVDSAAVAEEQDANVRAVNESDPVAYDVVQTPSLRADGTPDQTEPYAVLDHDLAHADVAERLRIQRISNADFSARRALGGVSEEGSEIEDPTIQALKDKHESAAGDVEGDADKILP